MTRRSKHRWKPAPPGFSVGHLRLPDATAELFFGPNALGHALECLKYGHPGDPDEPHSSEQHDAMLCASSTYTKGSRPYETIGKLHLVGKDLGVHAKLYVANPYGIIVSSQNNGASPFIEVAVALRGEEAINWAVEQILRAHNATRTDR